jgi:hypothetical protein
MSSDDERKRLLHEIDAWRDARNAHTPGSLKYKKLQRKMKQAEWELQRLGPSQGRLGFVIKIVDNKDASKE